MIPQLRELQSVQIRDDFFLCDLSVKTRESHADQLREIRRVVGGAGADVDQASGF